jgi:hypothetical protein
VTRRPTLEEARARLRELGYLEAGVERILFRPVFEGRGGAWLPAIAIGAFGAALAAVAAVEASEPGFESVWAAGVLFVHVFIADLAPAAILAMGLGWLADRSRKPGAAATAAGLAAATVVFALWIFGTYGLAREISARALLWGVPVAVASLFLAAAVRLAFLARAFARSGALPGRAARRVFLAAAAVALATAALLFSSRHEAPPGEAPRPSPRPVPTVVLAVDGLDLDGSGQAPAISNLLSRGATGWWPAEQLSPPELWTDLATGAPSRRHGVRALTRIRPAGSPLSLRPPLGTSWYLRRLGPLLHLVSNAPVSGGDRRSLDFWEVTASAGIPSLSVGWWASASWPGATVIDNRAILSKSADGVDADRVATTLFQDLARRGYGIETLYLPGCDIERDHAVARQAALARIQALLEESVRRAEQGVLVLVILAADSHPTSREALSRMVVFDRVAARTLRIRPADVAPSILARTGVPPARDLPGQPVASLFAPGTLETATVATYGPRIFPVTAAAPASDREYLEKLRSLGYLK